MASIFDLYSQKPPPQYHHRGPYKFRQIKQKPPSPGDSFLSMESTKRDLSPQEKVKLPLKLGAYQQVIRSVPGGKSIKVIRRKQADSEQLLPAITPVRQAADQPEVSPKRRVSITHGYMENRRYWDNLQSQLTKKPVVNKGRQLRKSKTMMSKKFSRSCTVLSMKASVFQPSDFADITPDSSDENQEWKHEIRQRATAMFYSMKGAPKTKKYMGQ